MALGCAGIDIIHFFLAGNLLLPSSKNRVGAWSHAVGRLAAGRVSIRDRRSDWSDRKAPLHIYAASNDRADLVTAHFTCRAGDDRMLLAGCYAEASIEQDLVDLALPPS